MVLYAGRNYLLTKAKGNVDTDFVKVNVIGMYDSNVKVNVICTVYLLIIGHYLF